MPFLMTIFQNFTSQSDGFNYWEEEIITWSNIYQYLYDVQGQLPQQQVKIPPYVKKLPSPMRNTYFNNKRKAQELLTSMVEVEK